MKEIKTYKDMNLLIPRFTDGHGESHLAVMVMKVVLGALLERTRCMDILIQF